MKKFILICFSIVPFIFVGQNYQVGHKQVTYIDPDRNNRSIQTEIGSFRNASQNYSQVLLAALIEFHNLIKHEAEQIQ